MFSLNSWHSIADNPFLCATAWFALSFLLAVVCTRALKPRREIPALFVMFTITTLLGGMLYAYWLRFYPWTLKKEELSLFVLINTATFLSYLIVHTAVESDSPSMILILHLWKVRHCSIPEALTLFRDNDPSVRRAEMLANSLLTACDRDGMRLRMLGRLLLGSVRVLRQISGRKMSDK